MRLCVALRIPFHTDHIAHICAPACADACVLLHGKRCFQIIAFVISEKRIACLPDRIVPDPGAAEHLQHLRPDLVMPPAGAVPAGGILSRARYRKALPERWAISQHRQGIREKHLRGLLQGGAAPCRADFPVTVPSSSEMHKSARKNSAQIEIVLHGYFQKSRYNTNNASLIARKIPVPQEKQINFSTAILVCKQFLKGKIRSAQIFEILSMHLSPIRPGRQYKRYQNPVSAVAFQYRLS